MRVGVIVSVGPARVAPARLDHRKALCGARTRLVGGPTFGTLNRARDVSVFLVVEQGSGA